MLRFLRPNGEPSELIAQLEARLAEQRELLDARIAELQAERDFYRDHFLRRAGLSVPEILAVQPRPIATQVTGEAVTPDEATQRRNYHLDKSDWSEGDYQWFEEEFVQPRVRDGMPRHEADFWYHREFGDQKPIEAFSGARPIFETL